MGFHIKSKFLYSLLCRVLSSFIIYLSGIFSSLVIPRLFESTRKENYEMVTLQIEGQLSDTRKFKFKSLLYEIK